MTALVDGYRVIEALRVIQTDTGRRIYVKPMGAVDFELFPYFTKDSVEKVETIDAPSGHEWHYVTVRLAVGGPVEID